MDRRRLILFDFLWLLTGLLAILRLRMVFANSTESNQQNEGRLFRENFQRLQNHGMCGTPRPRVYYVEDHPEVDATLTYNPSATVLHRCDPSGGCCRDRRKQCSALEESVVTVYFFVYPNVPQSQGAGSSRTTNNNRISYRSLEFVNHTQCICTDINDVPRR